MSNSGARFGGQCCLSWSLSVGGNEEQPQDQVSGRSYEKSRVELSPHIQHGARDNKWELLDHAREHQRTVANRITGDDKEHDLERQRYEGESVEIF